jgi:hypothetical protein
MAGLILRTMLKFTGSDPAVIKDIADRWVAATRSEEGVIGFHGFMESDGGRFMFLEHYRDSDAFMVHRDLVDPALRAELYSVAKFESLEVYGDPSDAVKAVLAPAGAAIFNHVVSR